MKKISIALFISLVSISASAQIYDGITQPTKFRIWMPVNTSLDGSGKVGASPFIGYRIDAAQWLTFTPVLQYNLNTENITPQVWVNFNYANRYYILLRSMYDTKTKSFRETVSATVKIFWGFMVDGTWENMYDGHGFADSDRLQFVAGYDFGRVVLNAGYSCRNHPGFIANIRFMITSFNWLQLRYDGGTRTLGVNLALQFN